MSGDIKVVRPPSGLKGRVEVPPDKSISHRALLLPALAVGESLVENFLPGDDCLATMKILEHLGVTLEVVAKSSRRWIVRVHGVGLQGLQEPQDVLDARNSGTTARLVLGMLSAQPLFAVLTGDASLRSRPMGRVVAPLRSMGARIWGRQGGERLPIAVMGGDLKAISYELPVASAQVKSALLLAGLMASGETVIYGKTASRDHTERMLRSMGADLRSEDGSIYVRGGKDLQPLSVVVPNDISSAAFWLVAGCIHSDADIELLGTGVNPTRAGVVDVLRRMGGQVTTNNLRTTGGEPLADLRVVSSTLRATDIVPEEVPRLIDEVPILAVAMCAAEGVSSIRGAQELRYKETDRLLAVATELGRMGAKIDLLPDGLRIYGPAKLRGAAVNSYGDHRMAMALAVAGLVAHGETSISDPQCVNISYPGFWEDLEVLCQGD